MKLGFFSRATSVARVLALALTAAACDDVSTGVDDPDLDVTYDFTDGLQQWHAGFADLPSQNTTHWELVSRLDALPAPLNASRKGILLSGINHSDDLFMYITRELSGLTPNATYAAHFRVDLATDAPRSCAGVGGSPGESVVLKTGVAEIAPSLVVDGGGHYRLNIDHGQQLTPGRSAFPIDNIATSNTDCANPRYELKRFDSAGSTFTSRADASGRAWLLVGVDSGFEGKTSVYVATVRVRLFRR